MKRIAILALLVGMSTAVFAQKSKVTTAALNMKSGDLEKAREAIDIAITNPKTINDPKAWYYRGDIYLRLYASPEFNDYDSVALDRSFESFKKAMEYDSKDKYKDEIVLGIDAVRQMYFNKANELFDAEKFDEAYTAISKYLEGNDLIRKLMGDDTVPIDTLSHFRKAYYAQLSGDKEEAMKLYQKLVDLGFNQSPFLYDLYATLLSDAGNTEKALEVLRAGQKVFPKNVELIIDELNIFLSEGKAEQAIDRFKEAIELDPENPDLHFALGTIYDNLYDRMKDSIPEKAEEYKINAITYYENALKNDPNYFKAVYNIGVIYFNEGVEVAKEMNNLPISEQKKYEELKKQRNEDFSKGLPYLEKAHQLDPEDLPTMKALKEIYFRLGQMEKYKQINDAIKARMAEGEK